MPIQGRDQLAANDYVDWASTGVDGDYLGETFNTTSHGGLTLTISKGDPFADGFERVDQGGSWLGRMVPDQSWLGSHIPNEALLWTGPSPIGSAMTITFSKPVFGVGANVDGDNLVESWAELTAYDKDGNLVFHSGSSPQPGDRSSFLGILNDVPNIGSIRFTGYLPGLGIESFAINQLDILTQPVPEATQVAGTASLLCVLSTIVLRSRRNRSASITNKRG